MAGTDQNSGNMGYNQSDEGHYPSSAVEMLASTTAISDTPMRVIVTLTPRPLAV